MLQGQASERMFEGGLELLGEHKGVGENCSERRKEAWDNLVRKELNFQTKDTVKVLCCVQGNGFLVSRYCYNITVTVRKMSGFYIIVNK